jgi:hypothetical protein
MSKRETVVMLSMGTLLSFSAGCLMEMEPDGEANDVSAVVVQPLAGGEGSEGNGIITGNGASALTPALLSVYAPLARLLTLAGLDGLTIAANDLLSTADGRTMLHYLVKCALPSGESLTASYLGVEHTFPGHVGIAEEWASGALTTSGRRWLSACLLAHVNATTTGVSILLRGDHPALGEAVGSQGDSYTLREGAFYGDIFGLVPKSYACSGVGSTSARVCTSSLAGLSPCGFIVPGSCGGACEDLEDDYYTSCHSGLILPLLPTTEYPETITVYLQP